MIDYFEMERVIEELAKAYPAQCATTWFKITKNHKPSKEEYRNKVVEYMKIFEYLLATFPQSPQTDDLKELVKESLTKEIEKVINGDNKDVERRHKHYVNNSPSITTTDTIKEVSEQPYLERFSESAVFLKYKKGQKNKKHDNDSTDKKDEKQPDFLYQNYNVFNIRRRKKRSMIS